MSRLAFLPYGHTKRFYATGEVTLLEEYMLDISAYHSSSKLGPSAMPQAA